MLLVRLLDREQSRREALRFVISQAGEVCVLSGDASLLDPDQVLRSPSGERLTRARPREWLEALARSSERFEVAVEEARGAGPAPGAAAIGEQPSAAQLLAAARAAARAWLARRAIGRLSRAAVGSLAVLAAACAVLGLWLAGAFRPPLRSFTSHVGVPRTALADESAPPPAPVAGSGAPGDPPGGKTVTIAQAAANAAAELASTDKQSIVSWSPKTGLWGRSAPAAWWQSALDLYTLVRYLEASHNTQANFQHVIVMTYKLNRRLPGTDQPINFGNQYMDDTGWWGIAWLEAARYELHDQHDIADARRFLAVAEWDANYIYSRPRPCHTQGIEWQINYPPDTITNAEFIALAAGLSTLRRQPGPFHDPALAAKWRAEAEQILAWLEGSGLVNIDRGVVRDTYNGHCKPAGGPLIYTQGEMAEALVALGMATRQPIYYQEAAAFLNRVLRNSWHTLSYGILQNPCEAQRGLCATNGWHSLDTSIYKSLVVNAMADWTRATGEATYTSFLRAQAEAVIANAATNGQTLTSCQTPHDCQLGYYWSRRINPKLAPMPVNAGTQEQGLSALTDALFVSRN
jgi:hypothetical protein